MFLAKGHFLTFKPCYSEPHNLAQEAWTYAKLRWRWVHLCEPRGDGSQVDQPSLNTQGAVNTREMYTSFDLIFVAGSGDGRRELSED